MMLWYINNYDERLTKINNGHWGIYLLITEKILTTILQLSTRRRDRTWKHAKNFFELFARLSVQYHNNNNYNNKNQ